MDSLTAFQRLEPRWREVYLADEHATVFTSWDFLAGWLEASPHPWRVLAIRPKAGGAYEGFLALSVKVQRGRWGVPENVLYLAGHPVTNHTGLLAKPEAEGAVLAALAAHLGKSRWRALSFELVSDPRLGRLAGQLASGGVQFKERPDAQSPYLTLPDNFESYLEMHFDGKARRELRRRQRKAESLGFRMTQLEQPDDLEGFLDAFLAVHEARFGTVEAHHLGMYRAIFARLLAVGGLHFQVLWDAETPVAAQVGFLDLKNCVYHGCQGGWDAGYADLAPGFLLKLEAVRYAVERRFTRFDLGRGAHDYKFGMGASSYSTRQLRLTRLSPAQRLKRRLALARDPEPVGEAEA